MIRMSPVRAVLVVGLLAPVVSLVGCDDKDKKPSAAPSGKRSEAVAATGTNAPTAKTSAPVVTAKAPSAPRKLCDKPGPGSKIPANFKTEHMEAAGAPSLGDKIPTGGPEEDYPDETYAELRVLTTREHTAVCMIVAAKHELERDAYLVARKGY